MEMSPARNARYGHVKDFAVNKELRRLHVPKAFSQFTHVIWISDVSILRSSRNACRNRNPVVPTTANIHPHSARHAQPRRDNFLICRLYLLPSDFRNHQRRKTIFHCTDKLCNCIIEMNILANTTKTKISWRSYNWSWHTWMSCLGLLAWQWIWISTVLSWNLSTPLWKSGNNLKSLGTRMVAWSKFHIQESQILDAIVRNVVARATWSAILFVTAPQKIKWQGFEIGHRSLFSRLFSRAYLWFNLTTNNVYTLKRVTENPRNQTFYMLALPNEPRTSNS